MLVRSSVIRKLIIALAAFAIMLGGFGPLGDAFARAAQGSENAKASSDCASMMDMKGSHEDMGCSSTEHDDHENSMKCPADNCALRCGAFSAPTVVSSVHYSLPTSLSELLPDFPGYVSAVGKPPLPPPRSSILA